MDMLAGKKALIVGIASTRSLAYGIAQAMHENGCEIALTYQNDKLKSRVQQAADDFNSDIIIPCDLSQDDDIENVAATIKDKWQSFDIIVHAAAYAPAEQLQGRYVDSVTREGFQIAHDISSYSFAALAKACQPMLSNQSALLTLSYIGSVRAMGNYNVMGVAKASLEANVRYLAYAMGPQGTRVNAVSSGPIRTLAASGIKDFRQMLAHNEEVTPLRHNTTIEEVGNTATFLCSNLASGITGEIVYVDSGFHIIG